MHLERILITSLIAGFVCCVVSGAENMTKRDFLACFNTPDFSIKKDIKFDATTSCLLAGAIKDVKSFNQTYERTSNDNESTASRVDDLIQNKGDKTLIDLSFLTLCTISTSFAATSPRLSEVLDVFKACDENAINWELLAQRMNTEIQSIVTRGNTQQCFDGSYVKERAAKNLILTSLLDNKTLFCDLPAFTNLAIKKLFAISTPQKIFTGFHLDHNNWQCFEQSGNGTTDAFQYLSSQHDFTVSHIVKKLLYAENYLNLEFDYNELSRILATNTKKRPHNSEASTPPPPPKRVHRHTEEANLTPALSPSHASNSRVINPQTGLPDELLYLLAIKIFNAWRTSYPSRPINTICTALAFSNDEINILNSRSANSSIIRKKLRRLRSQGEEQLTSKLIASLEEDRLDGIIDYIEKYKPFTDTSEFQNISQRAHGSVLTNECIRHIAPPLAITTPFEDTSILSTLIRLGMRLEDVDRCNGWDIETTEGTSRLLRAWVQTSPDLAHTEALIAGLQYAERPDIIRQINDFNSANVGQHTSTSRASVNSSQTFGQSNSFELDLQAFLTTIPAPEKSRNPDSRCHICHDMSIRANLKCGHGLCRTCVKTILRQDLPKCGQCRKPVNMREINPFYG